MAMRNLPPAAKDAGKRGSCSHHWHIEAPDGVSSRASCALCGDVRDFLNYLAYEDLPNFKPGRGKLIGMNPVMVSTELSLFVR